MQNQENSIFRVDFYAQKKKIQGEIKSMLKNTKKRDRKTAALCLFIQF